jgi:mono/diheme cytochrome c family protein
MHAMKIQMGVLFLLLLTFTVAAGGQTEAKRKTVWSGIYSAEQVARGEEEYKTNCSRCHGATLAGTQGNGLKGKDFMERWREDSMGSLYEFVTNSMPPVRKGVGRPLITVPTYLDILAFVLSQNDFPAGPDPLTAEGLDAIQIEYEDGPRPVPSGALVRIAGCLSGSGQVWNVTNANDPIRTRTSETLDYQEFQAAASEPSGTQSYRLANLGFLSSTFKPESHVGEKLMVKGNLVRQIDNSMRIGVLAVRKIADTCP